MLNEVVKVFDYLARIKNPVFVDGTIGLAGHSSAVAEQISITKKQETNKSQIPNSKLQIIGIDKDKEALDVAKSKIKTQQSKLLNDFILVNDALVNDAFENIKSILSSLKIEKVDGILLDLGVSSMQLDEGERGYSFQTDAPLDMRMDRKQKLTAAGIVNKYREEDLVRIFFEYGEEKFARRIASLIIKYRKVELIETTFELVEIIKQAIPKKLQFSKTHPATNVFRALRMEVNSEVVKLEQGIRDCVDVLSIGGRLAIITFHSIEDRIVKQTLKELADPCKCPKEIPECICGLKPIIKLINKKPITASESEIDSNPRSRSAKLRIAQKI